MIVTFNKQQLSELLNQDHFESLLNIIFLPQKSENVQPHSSNSIENATPSSGTSPLVSYKEVPPPPPGIKWLLTVHHSASLIVGSNLFQISELKLIDEWPHFPLAVDLWILFLDLV